STIPGVPPLMAQEVKEIVLGKIRTKGMGDGFEDAIRTLAVHNPNYLTVTVAQERDWADLEKILGARQPANSKPESIYVRVWGERPMGFKITWYSFGWLGFGVDAGKVRLVRASFPMFGPGLIAAEMVVGGRSPPDPSKALKKAKPRPANAPPPLVDAL